MDERRIGSWLKIRKEDIDAAGLVNISAAAVRLKNRSVGIVPADFKSVRSVLKKINGVSATVPRGSARTVRG
jgi:hypothetical protein